MNNAEKYRRAFDALPSSRVTPEEIMNMKRTKVISMKRIAVIAAAVVAVLALTAGAYAADVGGVQREVQLWIHGDQTDATIEFDGEGGYSATWTDQNGEEHSMGGGGVVYDFWGNERPATEEELLEEMMMPRAERSEDGHMWVCWMDQKKDVTDDFDENGVCYVKLVHDGQEQYLTVSEDGSYCTSPRRFPKPCR